MLQRSRPSMLSQDLYQRDQFRRFDDNDRQDPRTVDRRDTIAVGRSSRPVSRAATRVSHRRSKLGGERDAEQWWRKNSVARNGRSWPSDDWQPLQETKEKTQSWETLHYCNGS